MTVVVGILCEDGVVIGSDSSASLAAGQFRTVEQPAKKTFIVSDHIIMAGTGQMGIGQRFENVLLAIATAIKCYQTDPFQIAKTICADAIKDFGSTNCPTGQFGALVAFQSNKGCHLCEFAVADFQPEFKTDEQWFGSMGSGQVITDPFLGMLRRVFFNHRKPKLSEGLFAATWAIKHAIELNPGGINGPPQIAALRAEPPSKRMTARLLTEDELSEHDGNIEGVERHIGQYRQILGGGGAPEVTTTTAPPEPPAPKK